MNLMDSSIHEVCFAVVNYWAEYLTLNLTEKRFWMDFLIPLTCVKLEHRLLGLVRLTSIFLMHMMLH